MQTRWSRPGAPQPVVLCGLAASLRSRAAGRLPRRSSRCPRRPCAWHPQRSAVRRRMTRRWQRRSGVGAGSARPRDRDVDRACLRAAGATTGASRCYTFRLRRGLAADLVGTMEGGRASPPRRIARARFGLGGFAPGGGGAPGGARSWLGLLSHPTRGVATQRRLLPNRESSGDRASIWSEIPTSRDRHRRSERVHLHVYPPTTSTHAFADYRAGRLDYARVPPGQISLVKSDPRAGRAA